MLDERVIGLKTEQKFSYSWRDVILYNLSVGAQQEEVQYVYEKSLSAIPTFGVIPCAATFGTDPFSPQPLMPTSKIEGLKTAGTLHMSQRLEIYRPISKEGEWNIEKVISGVYDRGEGKGAMINVDISAKDEDGNVIVKNTMGYLNRWYGGFGGPKVPASTVTYPEREPDLSAEDSYPMNAPLLYRLTGDTYPLHADPEFAKACGFERPIVHGLCSLGHACRMLIQLLIPGQPERVTAIETQFRSIAMPGDKFSLVVWKTGENSAVFKMINQKTGKSILDKACIEWK